MKIALAVLMALTPVSAVADEYQRGYSASRTCYKSEYREEYVPGTADNPGYIKSWNETIEDPCGDRRTSSGTTILSSIKSCPPEMSLIHRIHKWNPPLGPCFLRTRF